jgi:hypothetical protein
MAPVRRAYLIALTKPAVTMVAVDHAAVARTAIAVRSQATAFRKRGEQQLIVLAAIFGTAMVSFVIATVARSIQTADLLKQPSSIAQPASMHRRAIAMVNALEHAYRNVKANGSAVTMVAAALVGRLARQVKAAMMRMPA